ncbi:DotU family type IV/VI secretion system protein [Chitiniphilus purpureus]|uniref:DotU family type IV/VI secretion system protein n=1 Tax=Chitiniphilus purpureus TaxID=2981137 RepID=A0ABY6DSB1_9NEIS|nr:DotU family type IV/VI secretion system protein [Chitiniphilus sp. CD1]UXY17251.1 DotU family type IV/VI secretion system protein [Chitiniphilus sp. CD1]
MMPAQRGRAAHFLLGCFAEFYEELALIKLAAREGRLPGLLTVGDEAAPTRGIDLAARICARLTALLDRQLRLVKENGASADERAYHIARYVMAALADEIFLLELGEWPGREPWLNGMLEYKLFRTRCAGRRFFELANRLLQTHAGSRGPLHADLAAVFLLALQLGFKGQYRGAHWQGLLREERQKLHRLAQQRGQVRETRRLFWQAYAEEHRQRGTGKGERLAPLAPWLIGGAIALLLYLLLAKAVWVAALWPLDTYISS